MTPGTHDTWHPCGYTHPCTRLCACLYACPYTCLYTCLCVRLHACFTHCRCHLARSPARHAGTALEFLSPIGATPGVARCSAAWRSAARCSAARCGAVRCGAMTVRCSAARCGAVRRSTAQRGAVRRGAVQCGAVYHTVRICSKPLHTFILYLVIGTKKKLNICLLHATQRSHLTFQSFRLGARCYTT